MSINHVYLGPALAPAAPPAVAPGKLSGAAVSTETLKKSGRSITTVRATGTDDSSNLMVTVIADWPGARCRPRAIEGCGGLSSTFSAAGRPAAVAASGPSGPPSAGGSVNSAGGADSNSSKAGSQPESSSSSPGVR